MLSEKAKTLILSLCREAGDDTGDAATIIKEFCSNHHPSTIEAAANGHVQALLVLRWACGLPLLS